MLRPGLKIRPVACYLRLYKASYIIAVLLSKVIGLVVAQKFGYFLTNRAKISCPVRTYCGVMVVVIQGLLIAKRFEKNGNYTKG